MKKQIFHKISLVALALIVSIIAQAQAQQWQDVYKVKRKDTVYGIATRYGITVEDLVKANPQISTIDYKLEKGTKLYIPMPKKAETKTEVAQQQGIEKVRIGVMLPLHADDGDGKRMIEYYRGILMALDSLKHKGISTEIRAWNVPNGADIRQTLLEEGAEKCHIIFGPLYTSQVAALGNFCKSYGIKMVIPFSISGDEVEHNPQIYRVFQSQSTIESRSVEAFTERFKDSHVIIINCNDTTSRKGLFTKELRKQLEQKGMKYSLTSIDTPSADFAKAFRMNQNNVVVLNTARSPELNTICARLNALTDANEKLQVTLFGYTEWLMYTSNFRAMFNKYNTYIPTYFYYNPLSTSTSSLENAYRRWFHADMQKALPRFAITGYDHAQYFVRGLHQYGAEFDGTQVVKDYNPIQTRLHFKRVSSSGGMQCNSFMLMHYTTNGQIEALIY